MVQVNIQVFLGFYAFIVFFAIILNPTQQWPRRLFFLSLSYLLNPVQFMWSMQACMAGEGTATGAMWHVGNAWVW